MIQRHPALSDRNEAFGHYLTTCNSHYGDPHHPETNAYLDQLVEIYQLPDTDTTMLAEMKKGKHFKSDHLRYALLRDLHRSIAYGVERESTHELFRLLNIWMFKDKYRLQILAVLENRFDTLPPKFDTIFFRNPESFITLAADCLFLEGNSRDFWLDFTRRVLEPMLILLRVEAGIELKNARLPHDGTSTICKSLVTYLAHSWRQEGLSLHDLDARNTQLSHSWHHPSVRFAPRNMDIAGNKKDGEFPAPEWETLLPEPYRTRLGYILCSYCTKTALDHAHTVLGHCIDTYVTACLKGESHIIAIEGPNGMLQSTVELKLVAADGAAASRYPFVTLGGETLTVMQHEGKKIGGQSHPVTNGPLHDALIEWLSAVSDGTSKLNIARAGRTIAYDKAMENYFDDMNIGSIISSCGYVPTWANLDRAFQEFKKDLRAGSIGVDANNRMVYPTRRAHLIDGTVQADGKRLSLRHMSAREWLRATGLAGLMADWIGTQPDYRDLAVQLGTEQNKPLTATLPAPLNQTQFAYALAAGTLPARELWRLTPRERAVHDQKQTCDRKTKRINALTPR